MIIELNEFLVQYQDWLIAKYHSFSIAGQSMWILVWVRRWQYSIVSDSVNLEFAEHASQADCLPSSRYNIIWVSIKKN